MVSLNNDALKDIDAFKVADLFHNLANLIKKQRETKDGNENHDEIDMIVPNEVQEIIKEFEQAQNKFIHSIDIYLHRLKSVRKKSDLEIVETIIKTFPGCLCSRNESGMLPIHCAAGSKFEVDFVPMLAKHGLKHNVGGKHGRGGLLVQEKYTHENALECITNVETLQILANSDPPLFFKEDVLNYDLLQGAVCNSNVAMAKWFISLCPSALYTKRKCVGIPLYSCRNLANINYTKMIKLCFEEAIKYDPSHPSIGGLFDKVRSFFIIKTFDDDDAIKAIAQVMSQHQQIPILHKVIEHTPELVDKIIMSCPHTGIIRDENNRLPIHVALERGMKTSMNLSSIMFANAQQLVEMDPVTKFCPSALAAMSPACDLNTIYHLIRAHPNHVEVGGRKHGRIHGRPSMPDSNAPHTRKRQK